MISETVIAPIDISAQYHASRSLSQITDDDGKGDYERKGFFDNIKYIKAKGMPTSDVLWAAWYVPSMGPLSNFEK